MALKLADIKAPIAKELDQFEKHFKNSMKSKVPLLDRITYYIAQRKGKQMRPMFVFFSALMAGGIKDATFRGAALIELLHTASLVHDDVVDDSYQRRGFFSVNALWKNKIAVLVGDFLYAKGLLLSIENDDIHLLRIMSNAVKEMSEGELMQIKKARLLDITEEEYFEIIRQKTASLIASACSVGVASVSENQEEIDKAALFGEKLGIAFQIRDDLMDYGTADIGKPTGIDIQEKKLTLPLIYALSKASKDDRNKMINIIKRHNKKKKKVAELIKMVHQSGGIEYTRKKMEEYQNDALSILKEFSDNGGRKGLEDLIAYTTSRKI